MLLPVMLQEFFTMKDCLAYFDAHGLSELPLASHGEEDSYHLPRVTPIDPIPDTWEMLPIDPQVNGSLTEQEVGQQRRIWELIQTEHSHLRTLETVINVSSCRSIIYSVSIVHEWTKAMLSCSKCWSAKHLFSD